MYTFASSRRLEENELRELERGLRCRFKYVGKIANVYEWWYQIRKKELTDKQKKELSKFELKLLGNFGKV